eukprot:6184412-Pleurochrysis_carterae.AAC.3
MAGSVTSSVVAVSTVAAMVAGLVIAGDAAVHIIASISILFVASLFLLRAQLADGRCAQVMQATLTWQRLLPRPCCTSYSFPALRPSCVYCPCMTNWDYLLPSASAMRTHFSCISIHECEL